MTREEVERLLLQTLDREGSISNSDEWMVANGIDALSFDAAIRSLQSDEYIVPTESSEELIALSKEATTYVKDGSPEAQVFYAVPHDGSIDKKALQSKLGAAGKIGFGQAMKNKWIVMGETGIQRSVDSITDSLKQLLMHVSENPRVAGCSKEDLSTLKKRKLGKKVAKKWYSIAKGPQFAVERVKLPTELTQEMLQDGSWKTTTFKEINLDAEGKRLDCGMLHPLMQVREQYRKILLEMGFEEMPTNQFVESSFWNFDSLFQPQQHPARDAHDTFFVDRPASPNDLPQDYVERVKKMHEEGGSDSVGWRYDWSLDEAKKNIMRTHTTAVSSRMLYKLAQQKEFEPKRYFSIDRVFRNEAVDGTHLAEFHQVEGFVADRNLTLGDLLGTIKLFFSKIGISNVEFKPAYNPYTEPSMEIFGYSEERQEWMEIGNSGIFRPEMLRPMGLPEDVSVIAWGLSLERPTMITYKYDDIRQLFGHKIDLRKNREKPAFFIP